MGNQRLIVCFPYFFGTKNSASVLCRAIQATQEGKLLHRRERDWILPQGQPFRLSKSQARTSSGFTSLHRFNYGGWWANFNTRKCSHEDEPFYYAKYCIQKTCSQSSSTTHDTYQRILPNCNQYPFQSCQPEIRYIITGVLPGAHPRYSIFAWLFPNCVPRNPRRAKNRFCAFTALL